jgi:predicted RNA-binding protein with PUA-like domain
VIVEQISNLLYRSASRLRELLVLQYIGRIGSLPIGNRRYSRLEICATITESRRIHSERTLAPPHVGGYGGKTRVTNRRSQFNIIGVNYWIVKQEPEAYSWSAFVKDGATAWTGVRNYQARNNLRAMKRGDLVLYYHSGDEKQAVGLARVSKSAYADPTASEGDWACVDLTPVKALARPVTLGAIKSDKAHKDILLVRNSRLSVSPLSEQQFQRLLALAETTV